MTSNISLSPHFSLKEMTDSQTAVKRGIANVPSEQEIENLRRLCQGTLEPLREALGLPIIITSGYRCKALNNIVGRSSKHSQHMAGCAADFYVSPRGVSGSKIQNSGSRFKVQGSRIKATELPVQGSRFKVQGSELLSSRFKATELQNPISKLVSGFKSLVSSLVKTVKKTEKPASRHELLIKAFRTIILDERIDYDQLILYPTFIHVSYVSRERNRRRLTKGSGDGKYCALSLEQALQLT